MTIATTRDVRVVAATRDSTRTVHDLFVETLGRHAVEDLDSFHFTVSPLTDQQVAPKLVTAQVNDQSVGAILGVYLRRVNGIMILYAGVKAAYRRQGLYTEMRNALLSELAPESPSGPEFLLSEVEDGSRLHEKYVSEWGAFIAPMDYVQPSVQGLSRRRLSLAVVPLGATREEIIGALPDIVCEVYRSVYRISQPDDDPDFRRMVESIRTS